MDRYQLDGGSVFGKAVVQRPVVVPALEIKVGMPEIELWWFRFRLGRRLLRQLLDSLLLLLLDILVEGLGEIGIGFLCRAFVERRHQSVVVVTELGRHRATADVGGDRH